MPLLTSKDGTAIVYDREGGGPAVIALGGAAVDRSAGLKHRQIG